MMFFKKEYYKIILSKTYKINFFICLLCIFNFTPYLYAQSLSFIKNKHQWNDDVLYKCKINSDNIYIQKNALLINIYSKEDLENFYEKWENNEAITNDNVRAHAYKVNLIGANLQSEVKEVDPLDLYHNYFIGNNTTNWASNVPIFKKIIQENIYSNIDWSIYSHESDFKYDFIVHAGADYHQIKVNYEGVDGIQINEEGHLVIKTSIKNIVELKPYAYQIIDNKIVAVKCNYIVNNNTVTYSIENYNKNFDLIIDPTIIMGTYSGARDQTIANCSAFDTLNNMYSSGTAIDGLYPVSIGAYRTSYAGMGDVVISKYNALGTAQIFATYLGGYLREMSNSIIIDHSNRIVLCGATLSPDFPTTLGCIDAVFSGDTINRDAFISILNISGSALLSSTYFGGRADDEITDIKLDDSLNIYVCGLTNSDDLTTTAGVYDNTYNGTYDAFVCKINSVLTVLNAATYFGAPQYESAYGLSLDDSNNIYVMGKTFSFTFPTSTSAVSRTYRGLGDGFAGRFNNQLQLLASTYVNTNLLDYAKMAIHDSGYVYILAYTDGNVSRFPTCKASSGFGGIFLSCYKENLDSLVYRIPLTNFDAATNITAFELSDSNYFLISSILNLIRSTFPDSIYTTDTTYRIRNKSLYYLCVSKNGEDIYYASLINSYFGAHIHGSNCRFNKRNNRLFHVICSRNTETATISAPYRFAITGGEFDMYSYIFQPTISTISNYQPAFIINDSFYCTNGYVLLQNRSIGINSYKWILPNAATDSINNTILFRNYHEGANIVKLIVKRNCTTIDTLIDTFYIPRKPSANAIRLSDSISCLGSVITCIDSIFSGNRSIWRLPNFVIDSTHDTIYYTPTTTGLQTFLLITDSLQCPFKKDTIKLNYFVYNQALAIITEIDTPICIPFTDSLRHSSIFYNRFKWWDDIGNLDSINNSFYLNLNSTLNYNIYLQVYNSYCDNYSIDTFQIKTIAPPIASISASQLSGCIHSILNFTNTSSNYTHFYWVLNDSIIDSTNINLSIQFNNYGLFNLELITYSSYCEIRDTQSAIITIFETPISIIDTVSLYACTPYNSYLYNHAINYNHFYWILPDYSVDSTHDTLSIFQNTAGDYQYQLIVFGDSCPDLIDTATVTLHLIAASSAILNISDTAVCNPSSIYIENLSTSTTNYQWILNDTLYSMMTDSLLLYFTNSGINAVTLISWNNICADRIDTAQILIEVMDEPAAQASISSYIGCPPLTVDFTNQSLFYDTIYWIMNDSFITSADSFNIVFTNSGIYSVKLIANNRGCNLVDTMDFTIQILHTPEAIMNLGDTALCIPDSTILINASLYSSKYIWYLPSIDSTNNFINYYQIDSGLYLVSLQVFGDECPMLSDSTSQYIYFKSRDNIQLNMSDSAGCNPLNIVAFLSSSNTNNRWTTQPSTTNIINKDTVNYHFSNIGSNLIHVEIYDSVCIESPIIIEKEIEIYPQSIASYFYTPIYLQEDSFSTFINNASFYDSITWYIDDTIAIPNEDSIVINPLQLGTHQICLITKNSYNCNDTSCNFIYVLHKPKEVSPCSLTPVNAFTPNNDGINDRFFIVAKTAENIEVKIFNRWGEQVYNSYSSNDFNLRNDYWDGTYKGRDQLMGAYTYIITATCPLTKEQIIKTGAVTLIR